MNRLTNAYERTTLAVAAIALSTLTLLAATVAPASAVQSNAYANAKPSVEVVMVSLERATRVN